MLNKQLFTALRKLYGEVTIRNENQRADFEKVTERKRDKSGRVRTVTYWRFVRGGHYGESYVLNCPFCSDTRRRFSVSYLFNTRDPETQYRRKLGVHCFNETECHTDGLNIQELQENIDFVYMGLDVATDLSQKFQTSKSAVVEDAETTYPGNCFRLHDTRIRETANARNYLVSRGFDWKKVSDKYNAKYLYNSPIWSLLDNRLVIPFESKGRLIGWTARSLTQDQDRKYINSRGSLGGFMYGLDKAAMHEVMVMVEGPLDRWAVGDCSFALLNASFSAWKKDRLAEAVQRDSLLGGPSVCIALLDPKQSDKEKARGAQHPLEKALQRVAEVKEFTTVLPCYLPNWLDPGASHGDYLAGYLRNFLRDKQHERLAELLAGYVRESSCTR